MRYKLVDKLVDGGSSHFSRIIWWIIRRLNLFYVHSLWSLRSSKIIFRRTSFLLWLVDVVHWLEKSRTLTMVIFRVWIHLVQEIQLFSWKILTQEFDDHHPEKRNLHKQTYKQYCEPMWVSQSQLRFGSKAKQTLRSIWSVRNSMMTISLKMQRLGDYWSFQWDNTEVSPTDAVGIMVSVAVANGVWLWWYRWSYRNCLGPKPWPLIGSLIEANSHWEDSHD
jgi:hypothetical protein